jgi:hypothetical protein
MKMRGTMLELTMRHQRLRLSRRRWGHRPEFRIEATVDASFSLLLERILDLLLLSFHLVLPLADIPVVLRLVPIPAFDQNAMRITIAPRTRISSLSLVQRGVQVCLDLLTKLFTATFGHRFTLAAALAGSLWSHDEVDYLKLISEKEMQILSRGTKMLYLRQHHII